MRIPFCHYHLFQLLSRFEAQILPLDLFLSHYFRSHCALGSKDRKTISEAAYGMIRWKLLIDHLVGEKAPLERRYHCYRTLDIENLSQKESLPDFIRTSTPQALFDKLTLQYGQKRALELSLINNSQAPITIRANTLKITRDALFERLSSQYAIKKTALSSMGITFAKREPFATMSEFKEGLFEGQDEASQLVALQIQPTPGELILDYCAGAAGKSLAFGPLLQGKGQLFLHDVRPSILQQAKKRLRRSGIQNAQIHLSNASLQHWKAKMDWVLVDAPCSGTGTLRRNPDLKWKFSDQILMRLILEQRTIFEEALSYLKPQGRIVYATCSLLAEENEMQTDFFIRTHGLKMIGEPFRSEPSLDGMDGFFAATLQKI